MKHLLVAVAVAAVACSGGQKTDSGTGKGTGAGSGSDTGSGSAVAANGPITRAECEDMAGHILQVGVEEAKKTKPPEEWPTTEQIDGIRNGWIKDDKWMQNCLAFDRASFTCVMSAADSAALQACMAEE